MICRLCQKEKTIRNSHVIPEFCYTPVYDAKHRIHEISTQEDVPNRTYRQKGLRERLLCQDCEQLLGRSERYVSGVLYGGTDVSMTQDELFVALENVDYVRFKHFQLSILWRIGVSTLPEFAAVDLGHHKEIIRRMVLNVQVGEPHEYGCTMTSVLTEALQPEGKVDVVDGLMLFPEKISLYGYDAYRLVFGGHAWIFVVSDQSGDFPHPQLFVSRDGRLVIPKVKAEETELFTKLGSTLKKTGKLN